MNKNYLIVILICSAFIIKTSFACNQPGQAPVSGMATTSPKSVCVGSNNLYYADAYIDPDRVDSVDYYWNWGDGTFDTTLSGAGILFPSYSKAHIYSTLGTYFLSVIKINTHGSDTARDTVIVLKSPVAGFILNSDTIICKGEQISITDTSSGDSLQYSWDYGNGLFDSTASPSNMQYTEYGTYTVKLTLSTAATGCTASIASKKIYVKENDTIANFGYSAGCPCNEILLNNLSPLVTTSFNWEFGDGTSSNVPNPSMHTYPEPGQYYISLKGTTATGCTYTKTAIITACGSQIPVSNSKSNNNWFFGDSAGITFNNGVGTPISIPGGQTSAIPGPLPLENGATISSPTTGNLLFYSDGNGNVYNSSHTIMQNGSGLIMQTTNLQSSLIIPFPGDTNQYYLFHKDKNGLFYSTIDILKDSITTKNITLLTLPGINKENLTGIEKTAPSCTSEGEYWVMFANAGLGASQKDTFYSFLIDNSGINNPIISFVNDQMSIRAGEAHFSPNGRKYTIEKNKSLTKAAGFYVFDFDNNTGILTNPKLVEYRDTLDGLPHGSAFSPNNKFYYQSYEKVGGAQEQMLVQFDLEQDDAGHPNNYYVLKLGGTRTGEIHLGLDGKLYVSQEGQSFLGVINNPDVKGLGANYINSGFALTSGTGIVGLQNIVPLNLPKPIDTFKTSFQVDSTNSCPSYTMNFINETDTAICSFNYLNSEWDFGDGITSTQQHPTHIYTSPDTYDVQLIVSNASQCYSDTIIQTVLIDSLPQISFSNSLSCINDTTYFTPDVNQLDSVTAYYWESPIVDSTQIGSYIFTTSGIQQIILTVWDTSGCIYRDTQLVDVVALPNASINPADTTLCSGGVVGFMASGGSSFQWVPTTGLSDSLSQQTSVSVMENMLYMYIATNQCGSDSITSTIKAESCDIFIPNVFSPNTSGTNDLFKVRGDGIERLNMKVYDRWGKKVFETRDLNMGWDGKINGTYANKGVYIYIINGKFVNGNEITLNGNVTLVK